MTPNWKVCFDNSSSIQKSTSKTQVYGGLSEVKIAFAKFLKSAWWDAWGSKSYSLNTISNQKRIKNMSRLPSYQRKKPVKQFLGVEEFYHSNRAKCHGENSDMAIHESPCAAVPRPIGGWGGRLG